MFGTTNTIAKRVASVIKERVRIAQERYDQSCNQIDTDTETAVQDLYTKAEDQKERLADDLVRSVIG